jgi:beta-lactamase regulating signal transducer with metallopeptidase domain/peptidoglycan/xylan/chitin deacetylase (PgdA/CDA1 family)
MSELFFTLRPVADAAGWALVHSLWQGALLAVMYACFAALTERAKANVRYAGAVVALALLLVLPVLTAGLAVRSSGGLFAREAFASEGTWADSLRERVRASRETKDNATRALEVTTDESVSSATTLRGWLEERLTAAMPWLVFAWLAGVLLLASRFVGAWLLVMRLRRSAAPVAERFEELLARVSEHLRVSRAVELCQSALVEVPTVVGHLRPLILIPAGAFVGLTPRELEAVLAHELAHVRRYDYVINLLQTAVETLLFYHPAAWWLSGCVRAEREHACDDAAVEATGDVLLYARALTALEQLRGACAPTAALALAANGGSLMQRIQRLVNRDQRTQESRHHFAAAAVSAALLCGILIGAHSLISVEAKTAYEKNARRAVASVPRREVAVTFVNYPGNIYDAGRLANKTRKLLRSLAANDVRAVAFVNESRLYKDDGSIDEARVQTLRDWLDAGHELGNETAHHTNLFKSPVEDFETDVVRGDQLLSKLSAERGRKVRYFSYPYLNTGANLEARSQVERFLSARGYRIHPVTVDNMDWLFSRAYIEALRREDEAAAASIRAEYVPYMERMFEFYESYSREVTGREIPQVLMLTAGALNADCFDDLAAMMKRRGYSFVTMEQATKDEAYNLPDTYTGVRGDSWLARWAVTKGLEYKDTEEVSLPETMQQYLYNLQKGWRAKAEGEAKK